ncbi:MAG TPA: 50S ribosomal protein L7/L12 [Elusimicrobiota bacterium]|jgi:ribosomal protein L7/L12|nr:50S ribosomal protein L7/L12 [Elusimicrobiota bacterium]HMX43048.1 50S ribosomal protein L7/L12 [Elusimicrobiota bacterium]HMZ25747.1 50S ribosomal protein L7/L12 [Elusimicrobiota bacterium]HNF58330.1 50S ribosomal protein L7/L12 [Elusimicrobiota bacterium]HNG44813.1 50S ribosomal protein L7/L12 [Elusimicrobiota bacterium]
MKPTEGLPPDVLDALNRGQFLEAIKRLRTVQNLDLKTAKDSMDAYLKNHPELMTRIKLQQEEFLQQVKKWLWIAGAVAAGLWLWRYYR